MEFEPVLQEFNIRYYRWAIQDFNREIERGFPFLKGFKSGSPWDVLEMMVKMPREKQCVFAKSLVKRFHTEAVTALGEVNTPEERELCDAYLNREKGLNARELEMTRRLKAGERGVYASRAKLTKLVRNELEKSGMQMLEEPDLDGVLIYTNTIGGWQIITRIHTREKIAQLAYDHAIWSVKKVKPVVTYDGQNQLWPVQLERNISLTSWLGITSRTEWSDLTDPEGPQAAKELAILCKHFLNVAPELLAGLHVDSL